MMWLLWGYWLAFDISISYITELFVRVSMKLSALHSEKQKLDRTAFTLRVLRVKTQQMLVVSVNKPKPHAAVSLWSSVCFLCDWQSCGLGRRSQLMFGSLLWFLLHLMTRFLAYVLALTKPRPGQNRAISAHW